MVQGSQGFVPDPRNDAVRVWVNGQLVPRAEATVSVFDAGFILGDGVWEGFRLVNGQLAFLDAHLDRLFEGAAAIDLDVGMERAALTRALYETVEANGMSDGVHVRLMVTRGTKLTPNQDPRYQAGGATVVIVAEHKTPNPELQARGMKLATSSFRTSAPDVFDMRLNSHSRLNLVQALIQAIRLGAHEALMLDPNGFVASCNATNFFIVRGGEVWTSTGLYCFNGITRGHVIALGRGHGIPVLEKEFTLAEVYTAGEAFVTGTFGGVTPVAEIDGRTVGSGVPGPVTARLAALYRDRVASDCPA
jgi:branched-chain amino acid aminotransferase